MYLNKLLCERVATNQPVTVGLVGAGRFGTTVAAQRGQMSGVRLGVVCDLREINARAALEAGGADSTILRGDDPSTVADVVAVAKGNLEAGDKLDGSGGSKVRGVFERYEVSLTEDLLPLCMSAGARLNRPAEPRQPITFDMVDIDEGSTLWKLRRAQDNMFDRTRSMSATT